jgi:ubiquinone/menaquinone biosynthesis C-methylase UbiE
MEEQKRRVVAAFDLASDTYDEPALRCFDLHARALVREAQVHEGAQVLDVATGTGKVAFAAARAVGPKGRIIGIDLSGGMLAQARHNTGGLPVEFRLMDAERLEFDDATFDVVLCGFAVWFLPDMLSGMREMRRVLRPGGRLAFSTWAKQSHEPMMKMMQARLERYGIPRTPPPPEPWKECSEPEHLLTILEKIGFRDRQVVPQPAGYFIQPEDWWTFLWGAAPRGRLSRLPPESLDRFREEILEEVRSLKDDHGIWFDVSALIGIGLREYE